MSSVGPSVLVGLEASAQVEALASLARGIRGIAAAEVPAWAAARASVILGADVRIEPLAVLIPAPTRPESGSPGSGLSVPLLVDGHRWGDLRASRPSAHDFTGPEQACADLVASLVVGALEKAALEKTSNRDPLTGLANRRALDDAAATLLARVTLGSPRRVTAVCVGASDPGRVSEVAILLMRYFSALSGSLVARVGESDFTVLVADHPVAEVAAVADSFSASADASPSAPEVYVGLASTAGTQPWETAAHLLAAARKACERARRERGISLPAREPAASTAPGPGA